MRKILLILLPFSLVRSAFGQDIQVRVRETVYNAVDPDGAGPAKGTVTFRFELKSTGSNVFADGLGLSVVYQSSLLAAAPSNTTQKLGPINNANWTQQVDNRAGNAITPVTYGGRTFDRRMIITFNQNSGMADALISGTAWTQVAQITYYTLGTAAPEGGYITPEPATTVAQNELSSDGGLTTYPYLSPELNAPVPLSSTAAPLPVLLTRFEAQCQPDRTTRITWATAKETNNGYFDVEKSENGTSWASIGKLTAASANSTAERSYQFSDAQGGTAQYRLRQVDRDGKITYSDVVKTSCDGRSVYVLLYPVPARDVINLVVGSDKALKTALQVYDANGKLLINRPASLAAGINNFKIPVQHLAAGDYIIKGTNGDIEISKRFTIVR